MNHNQYRDPRLSLTDVGHELPDSILVPLDSVYGRNENTESADTGRLRVEYWIGHLTRSETSLEILSKI